MSSREFAELYERLRAKAHWGTRERPGALGNIVEANVRAAANEVRLGRLVSLGAPMESSPSADNPDPVQHEMSGGVHGRVETVGCHFAMDRFAMNVHGNGDTHLDALCHVIYNDKLYGDVTADSITPTGATALSLDADADGIAGRCVLLDIPRVRDVEWLEPGDHVTVDDLVAAEHTQHVSVRPGDLLFVRVGHRSRRARLGPWNAAEARAGLHPIALEFVAERRVALLGSDGNSDTAPSTVEGVDFPAHVLAINAMGVQLIDYLQLDAVVPYCEQLDRWSFFCVIAPLRLPNATGSPVNPIAIL
jgi:kynurenine formamidase